MVGGTLRRHGLGVYGGGFCLVSHGSQARGLPCLALTAQQWRGHDGGPRRSGGGDAVAYRAPIALSCKSERINAETPDSQQPGTRP
jgi:hypothetical protein